MLGVKVKVRVGLGYIITVCHRCSSLKSLKLANGDDDVLSREGQNANACNSVPETRGVYPP